MKNVHRGRGSTTPNAKFKSKNKNNTKIKTKSIKIKSKPSKKKKRVGTPKRAPCTHLLFEHPHNYPKLNHSVCSHQSYHSHNSHYPERGRIQLKRRRSSKKKRKNATVDKLDELDKVLEVQPAAHPFENVTNLKKTFSSSPKKGKKKKKKTNSKLNSKDEYENNVDDLINGDHETNDSVSEDVNVERAKRWNVDNPFVPGYKNKSKDSSNLSGFKYRYKQLFHGDDKDKSRHKSLAYKASFNLNNKSGKNRVKLKLWLKSHNLGPQIPEDQKIICYVHKGMNCLNLIEMLEYNYPDGHLIDKVMGLNEANDKGMINLFDEQIKVNDDVSKYENIRIMLQRHKKGTSHPLHLVNKSSNKSGNNINNNKQQIVNV